MNGELASLLTSFILVTLAELGDKTQIAAILLASKFKPFPVFIGGVVGFLVVNLFCFILGCWACTSIPYFWARVGAALLFIVFGLLLLRNGGDKERIDFEAGSSALFTSFALISSMELADKTNLSVLALALNSSFPVMSFVGVVFSAFFMMGLSVTIGSKIRAFMRFKWVFYASSLSFILIGVYILMETFLRI